MDLFEFILTITSVIFALAVTEILSGISRLSQSRFRVTSFLPHTLWVINLFVFIFLIWWATWEFRDIAWSFSRYVYVLIAPTLVYFACSLLMPQQLDGPEVRLEDHFRRIRKPLFGTFALATIVVMVDGNVLADEPFWHGGRAGNFIMLGLAAWAFFTDHTRTHKVIAVLTLLTFLGLIAFRFWMPR